jgi:lipopolysaccharide/colanic/teichoic acid biosynthesis glycosyltransferase
VSPAHAITLPVEQAAQPAQLEPVDDPQRLAVQVWTRPNTVYDRLVKPAMDWVAAAVLLLLTLPVLLVVSLLVRLQLGSPVFFIQERVGKGGKPFRMLKFRTMSLDRRNPGRACYEGPERRYTHKSPNDPRHTGLGRFLRKSKLDELPQLVHVLAGKMSLVGPRPELAEVVATRYEPWQHARHVVRPGVTGLWQVTTDADVHGRMHLATDVDLRYILASSLLLDLQIVFATVFRRFVSRLKKIATSTFPG